MAGKHDPESMRRIVNRLKRAEGQLHSVIASIGSEADCRSVVIQLAAVSKALDKAGYAIIANAMVTCVIDDEDGQGNHDGMTPSEIEKLFLTLA
jgi:DNA-binding FrmR family transcriptional regulator